MNEEDLRDCFAMFALVGMVMNGNRPFETMHEEAYKHADAMLEARKLKEKENEEDSGIVSVVPKRSYKRKG